MLMSEEFALIALIPGKGRHPIGSRQYLNACLAGLLLGDLVLAGAADLQPKDAIVLLPGDAPAATVLAGAAQVVADKGPKIKAVLSGMDRGLHKHAGQGTWDAVVAGVPDGDSGRDEVIGRLIAAGRSDGELEPRTALLLSMLGPARLLESVAPRAGVERGHARDRIDHATDGTPFEAISRAVRKIILEDQTAAIAATSVVTSG